MQHFDTDLCSCLLVEDEVLSTLSDKSLIIFGAGNDGKTFLSKYKNQIDIKFFIDNNSYGKKIDNYDVLPVDECLNHKEKVIIITSSKYYQEMIKQLKILGLKPKENFYVFNKRKWAEKYRFDFCEHNKLVWKRNENDVNRKNKILLTYGNYPAVDQIILSYAANYLADEYDAELYGVPFLEPAMTIESFNNNYKYVKDIHASFNVKSYVLDNQLTELQKDKAQKFFDDVWNNITTEDDVYNIHYKGVHYGGQILRDFYRYYMPSFEIKNEFFKNFLILMIQKIIFWTDYFENTSNVKAFIATNGIYREAIPCHAAIAKDIKVYAVSSETNQRIFPNINYKKIYQNYKNFFSDLTIKQQNYGLQWAKEELVKRFKGKASDPSMEGISPYLTSIGDDVLEKNDKIKVLICTHSFNDDLYCEGKLIFSSVWTWLLYLGELSQKTAYDWYLKEHPAGNERDSKIIAKFLSKYKKIKLIPKSTSPYQLKKEGIKFALTVWGTIGHEYPALGIQVINAGSNRHIAFDFDWNPKTRAEYEYYLLNLDKLNKEVDLEEIYKFYCIHYLYYDFKIDNHLKYFFNDKEMQYLNGIIKHLTDVEYKKFLDGFTPKKHKEILSYMPKMFEDMDNFRQDVFYRKNINYKEDNRDDK